MKKTITIETKKIIEKLSFKFVKNIIMWNLWPKWNQVWRKKREREPWSYTISWVMSNFLSLATGVKKQTIQSYFSREKKSLANLQDCWEYLRNNIK